VDAGEVQLNGRVSDDVPADLRFRLDREGVQEVGRVLLQQKRGNLFGSRVVRSVRKQNNLRDFLALDPEHPDTPSCST
uniref:Uncharacterized protein n=1 Tax=Poecilia formosa TaxID=48698 RepID=A0A096M708_POEFO